MAYKYREYDFNKDIKKLISTNIRKYRKMRNLTQEELALYTDRSFEFIRRIEAPNMKKYFSIETIFNLSKALNIEMWRLFYNDNANNKNIIN